MMVMCCCCCGLKEELVVRVFWMEKGRLKEKIMVFIWSLVLKEKGKGKELGFFMK